MIIQPETVRRWRRNGWSGLWRYRSGGRWRGGRPRVSREVRELINRMARELPLGCTANPRRAAHAWVQGFPGDLSRYLATVHRSPGQSWRTFIRNQALAFRYRNDLEYEARRMKLGHRHGRSGGSMARAGPGFEEPQPRHLIRDRDGPSVRVTSSKSACARRLVGSKSNGSELWCRLL
jgi:hypothetical protein